MSSQAKKLSEDGIAGTFDLTWNNLQFIIGKMEGVFSVQNNLCKRAHRETPADWLTTLEGKS